MTIGEIRKVKKFFEKCDVCQITESFNNIDNTYKAELLDIWQENGIVGLYDYQNNVLNLGNIMTNGFIMSSAELILYKDQFIIKLKDGTISVKVIA